MRRVVSEHDFLVDAPFWFHSFYESLSTREVFSQKTSAIIKSTGKSREYVCRLFKAATGQTLGVYLNNIRIAHACRLLESGNADIIDIALEAGFENLSTFYHLFRSHVGISPKQYRINKQKSRLD